MTAELPYWETVNRYLKGLEPSCSGGLSASYAAGCCAFVRLKGTGLKELADYRLARAKEMLSVSDINLETGQYKTSLNRFYYAVFHAMRSANVLKGFDLSKHSEVIVYFTKE